MDTNTFFEKLKTRQINSQLWNAVIEDVIVLYMYHFKLPEQLFTSEELWDFLFTYRDNHITYNKKIWDTFSNVKYNMFFKIVYTAIDDPDINWWKSQCL